MYVCVRACMRAPCVRIYVYVCVYLYLSFNLNAQLKELITVLILSYFMKQLNM